MFEYIRQHYGLLFSAADLPGFVAAGWITGEQADRIVGPEEPVETQADNVEEG